MNTQEIINNAKTLLERYPYLTSAVADAEVGNRDALSYLKTYMPATTTPAAKPKTGWHCERCGARLPKADYVWKRRFQRWQQSGKANSGFYCDPCADSREAGWS